jgi:hypothetical protein
VDRRKVVDERSTCAARRELSSKYLRQMSQRDRLSLTRKNSSCCDTHESAIDRRTKERKKNPSISGIGDASVVISSSRRSFPLTLTSADSAVGSARLDSFN